MDTCPQKVPQRWVETSTLPSTPAPEIVRTFISDIEGPLGINTLFVGRMFRSHGIDNSSLGAPERSASSPAQNEENPGNVGFVPEGAD